IAGSGVCACALIPTIGGQPATTPSNTAKDTFSHIERIAPSPVFKLGPHTDPFASRSRLRDLPPRDLTQSVLALGTAPCILRHNLCDFAAVSTLHNQRISKPLNLAVTFTPHSGAAPKVVILAQPPRDCHSERSEESPYLSRFA